MIVVNGELLTDSFRKSELILEESLPP